MIVRLAMAFPLVILAAGSAHAADADRRNAPHATDLGIWKSYAPTGLHGEFHNYDPVGLMAGALIHTDCSINFTDPDTHKVYCFNSATSQVYFTNWPKAYAAKAAAAFGKIKRDVPTQ